MSTNQLVLSLSLNAIVILFVFLSTLAFFRLGGQGNMKEGGKKALVYFTVDSNLLCALASLFLCVWDGLTLVRGGEAQLPRWLDLFKFTGSAAVGVTFFTTLCYLLPVTKFDFKLLYAGWNFCLHALCPLAAMVSWTFAERSGPLPFPWVLLSLLPTTLYGALYFWKVVIRKRWKDFYSFNAGGLWYVSVFVMLLLSFGIGAGLWALQG